MTGVGHKTFCSMKEADKYKASLGEEVDERQVQHLELVSTTDRRTDRQI